MEIINDKQEEGYLEIVQRTSDEPPPERLIVRFFTSSNDLPSEFYIKAYMANNPEFIKKSDSNDFTKRIIITEDDDYTHAVIINVAMPKLKIKRENVFGMALEPLPFLGITEEFIDYASKNIGIYYIGQLFDLLKPHTVFVEHCGYLNYDPPSQNTRSLDTVHTNESNDTLGNVFFALKKTRQIPNHITNKNKIMSIAFSHKQFADGHKYRHLLVRQILQSNLPIDIYGKGCHLYPFNDSRIKGQFSFAGYGKLVFSFASLRRSP
jgi:hypothetical protein